MSKRAKLEAHPRLGRGLAALLGTKGGEAVTLSANPLMVPIDFLRSSTRNPRRDFDVSELNELAESIRTRGILQPILVRIMDESRGIYEIVAGERRWRAAQIAALHTVPVIKLDLTDRDALEISVIENVQRSDLSSLEEAQAYARLASEYGYNHTDIGRIVGKSRSHVANTLRLLTLPAHTQSLLASGALTAGHARALLPLANPNDLANKIVSDGLTVREVEGLSATIKTRPLSQKSEEDVELVELQSKLSLHLGVYLRLKKTRKGAELFMKMSDVDQLTSICDRLLKF